jgi:putative transcriptional regulator
LLDLTNHFLIAMPSMVDDDFERAVVFIFDHGKNGAAGLVVNRPSESTIKHMFDRMDMPLRREDLHTHRVFEGGPAYTDRGFVLHEAQQTFEVGQGGYQMATQAPFYASTLAVPGGLEMTTSHDVLDALASGAGPQKIFIALGYASWHAGQLEDEIIRNDWLTVPAKHELIFDVPVAERYKAALALLGIDEVMLSSTAGCAAA